MKKFLKENIIDMLLYLLLFACGLALPITLLVNGFIYGEIFSGIVLSLFVGSPILVLLGFVIWMFVEDYKTEKLMEEIEKLSARDSRIVNLDESSFDGSWAKSEEGKNKLAEIKELFNKEE